MAEDQSALRTLSEVVRERRLSLGLSTRALADRCVDLETGLAAVPRHYIERLEGDAPNLTPPRLPVLEALAVGLELPLSVLQDAAGYQFHGTTTQHLPDGKARVFVAEFEEFDEAEQEQILAMLQAFAAARRKKKD
ncbi:XRE family transcriptional regulator [Streptomyces laurentii]|uniref:XRE family transcriptional regulator n=1 Tax=Streptomyces laurentii TaxID=39478 RepID=UPI003690B962